MMSGIECDRKQGKYKRLEPSKGDRRSGAENTPNGMKPILSQKRTKTSVVEDTDRDRWCDKESLLKECYEFRKRERVHEDGSFMHHQKGPITTTYDGLEPQRVRRPIRGPYRSPP